MRDIGNSILITRVNSQNYTLTMCIDHIQGSIPADMTSEVIDHISDRFGSPNTLELKSKDELNRYGRYNRLLIWDNGACKLWYDHTLQRCDSLHNGRVCLVFHATALQQLSLSKQMKFHRYLSLFDFKCTRYDIALDDYSFTLNPAMIAEQAELGNFARFKKHEIMTDDFGAVTVAFGSRGRNGAGKYIRCYDKEHLSDGEIPAYRMELELSGDRSANAFRILCEANPNKLGPMFVKWLTKSICFYDRQSKPKVKELSRLKELEWWSSITTILSGDSYIGSVDSSNGIENRLIWVG